LAFSESVVRDVSTGCTDGDSAFGRLTTHPEVRPPLSN